jgi:hypothetical protein
LHFKGHRPELIVISLFPALSLTCPQISFQVSFRISHVEFIFNDQSKEFEIIVYFPEGRKENVNGITEDWGNS